MLDTATQNEIVQTYGKRGIDLLDWRLSWLEVARPKQLPPVGAEWDVWSCIAGRGWGKTRVGAEHLGFNAAVMPKSRWAVVAPTQNDCRSVCFEGESGLLEVIPKSWIKTNGYNRSLLELELITGALITGKSAEKPDRLRGPQFHGAWCDELASWGATAAGRTNAKTENKRLEDTWSNLQFGLRLGKHPRTVVTTTPRPLKFLRDLVAHPRTRLSHGPTWENKRNLASTAIRALRETYEGTRKGAQELQGLILEDVEGALWSRALIAACYVKEIPDDVSLVRVVVAVDPAVTSESDSDEWAIIVAGLGDDGKCYVLDDSSGVMKPKLAASTALIAYERYEADVIVAEVNQGGDLVESVFRAEDPQRQFAFKTVRAKRGKYLRAEPVQAYYEKGKVKHVGHFPKLENQMCEFVGSTTLNSPDRLDALVYAILELMSGVYRYEFY